MKKINISFFILLILFIQVIISDTIIYFTKISYGFSNIIALTLNTLFIIFLIRKKHIEIKSEFDKWDLIFIAIVLILIAGTIAFPDTFYDSYSYHLYLQENPFKDKINDDFFPGRTLTSFVFPIADRIFYMFRAVLGFRMGTICGYALLIVLFYQVKKFLKLILKEKIKKKYISLLSIVPLMGYIILQQIGTYYIDNFSVVLLLEFVYILLTETENLFKKKQYLYYLALLVSIAFSVKITNAIYIIGPLIYMLIKNIRNIKLLKWYDYFLLIITSSIAFLPYLLNAIIQTGSPVFPYYNSIFKSEYYEAINWVDKKYGPKNIMEFLLWPIYIMIYPRKAYEIGMTDLAFPVGYILIIVYFVKNLYKKIVKKEKIQNKIIFKYNLVLIYFYIVWAKLIIGYTRYAGAIIILSMILVIKLLVDAIYDKNIILIIFSSIIILVSSGMGIFQYLYNGSAYNYSLVIQGNLGVNAEIKDNYLKLFNDRKYEKYDIDGIWGVINDDSAVPMFLNFDDRLVHLESNFKTGETEKSKSIYWKNVLNNDIYVPLYSFKIDGKLKYFDKFHFEIIEIKDILTKVKFLEKFDELYIVKVKYNANIKEGQNKEIFERLKEQINDQ